MVRSTFYYRLSLSLSLSLSDQRLMALRPSLILFLQRDDQRERLLIDGGDNVQGTAGREGTGNNTMSESVGSKNPEPSTGDANGISLELTLG